MGVKVHLGWRQDEVFWITKECPPDLRTIFQTNRHHHSQYAILKLVNQEAWLTLPVNLWEVDYP